MAKKEVARKITRNRLCAIVFHVPLFALFIAKVSDAAMPARWEGLWWMVLWVAALLPLVSFAGLFIRSSTKGNRAPDKLSLLCRAIMAFCIASLLSLAALWFFYRIYRGRATGAAGVDAGHVPLSLLILCTLVVILTNLAVSVLFHDHRRSALLASFLAALLLLGAGQLLPKQNASLPTKIMESFGFGVQNATLVLTERGGRLLCAQEIPVRLEKPKQTTTGLADDFCARAETPTELGKDERTKESLAAVEVETQKDPQAAVEDKPRKEILARAEKLTILSRLGSEYLLRFEGQNKKTITAVLPKSEVVSWSIAGPAGG